MKYPIMVLIACSLSTIQIAYADVFQSAKVSNVTDVTTNHMGFAHCDNVLHYAATDIITEIKYNEQEAYAYYMMCEGKYTSASKSKRFSLDVLINQLPLGFKAGGDSTQSHVNQWCKTNQDRFKSKQYDFKHLNVVNQAAVHAWSTCVDSANQSLKLETTISEQRDHIQYRMTYFGPSSQESLRAVSYQSDAALDSLNCKVISDAGQVPVTDGQALKVALTPGRSLTVQCKRNKVEAVRDGQSITLLPNASIALTTSINNFMLSYPEKSSIHLTDKRADAILDQIHQLKGNIGKWPVGKYCIFRSGGSCPTGFTLRSGHLRALATYASNTSYIYPVEFGDSSIKCHGYCGQYGNWAELNLNICCK